MHVYGPGRQDCPRRPYHSPDAVLGLDMTSRALRSPRLRPALSRGPIAHEGRGQGTPANQRQRRRRRSTIGWRPRLVAYLSLSFEGVARQVILFGFSVSTDLSFDRLFIEGVSFYSGGPVAQVGSSILSVIVRKLAGRLSTIPRPERAQAHAHLAKAGRSRDGRWFRRDERRVSARSCVTALACQATLSPTAQRHCTFAYGEKDSDLARATHVIHSLYPEAEAAHLAGLGSLQHEPRLGRLRGDAAERRLGSASTDRS